MFMGYIYITCHECGREVKHHTRDIPTWPSRICPKCGETLQIRIPAEDQKRDS